MTSMQNRMNGLGLFCALMIPALGILNRDSSVPDMSVGQLAALWLILSAFLLVIWLLNAQLDHFFSQRPYLTRPGRITIIAGCDVVLILLCFGLDAAGWLPISFHDYNPHSYQIFGRLCVATLLMATIQYAFQSTIRQEMLKRQNEQLRSENLVAELEGLKQQLNPHFLFNSLGTLRAMVRERDANAEQFVLRLSAVYRQFLSKHNQATISLPDELEFLENYLFMLRFRYENQLTLTVDVNPQLRPASLPTFCLQLLVENCLKHNVLSATKPLSIRIYQDTPLSVTVENNRQPKLTDVDSTGIGLDNLRKRYQLLGVSDAVTVRETDTTFAVTVALLAP